MLDICSRYLYKLDHFVIKSIPPPDSTSYPILLKLRSVRHVCIYYILLHFWRYMKIYLHTNMHIIY